MKRKMGSKIESNQDEIELNTKSTGISSSLEIDFQFDKDDEIEEETFFDERNLPLTEPSLSNKETIPFILGISYFFYNASTACIMPYLSVFFHDIGMDAESIGLLQSVRTSLTIIAAPIWGAIAAKFRAVTLVLMVCLYNFTLDFFIEFCIELFFKNLVFYLFSCLI